MPHTDAASWMSIYLVYYFIKSFACSLTNNNDKQRLSEDVLKRSGEQLNFVGENICNVQLEPQPMTAALPRPVNLAHIFPLRAPQHWEEDRNFETSEATAGTALQRQRKSLAYKSSHKL